MVRSVTFEIRWHDMQPIYGNSFQPISPSHLRRVLDHNQAQAAGLEPGKMLADAISNADAGGAGPSKPKNAPLPLSAQGQSWRLATAGGDNHARIWLVHPNIPSPAALAAAANGPGPAPSPNPPRVEYRATLRRHSGVVNCARFSPNGELLATTGDDGMVLLWIPSDAPTSAFGSALDDDLDADFAKEHWRLRTMARASSSEVYDLAWSPTGDSIVTGGTDFVARIINANDGTVIREISEHNHYVQGVAWDPLSEYIATQSSDRSVHVHQLHARNSSSEISAVHTVSRNTRLDLHRRTGSGSGPFVWDPSAKPPMKRRASSHASHASDSERENQPTSTTRAKRTGRSSTPLDIAAAAAHGSMGSAAGPSSASSAGAGGSGGGARAATPTPSHSVTPSPAGAFGSGGMNPPQKTPSRRSSFSGSQAEVLSPPTSATSLAPTASNPPSASASATTPHKQVPSEPVIPHPPSSSSRSASRNRAITPRSPSPAPPLPAIRAPPSPKQRMAAAQGGQLAKVGMRLYGDENFSGFFRRLTFSPDGALLVTPTGIFENCTVTNGTGGNGSSNGSSNPSHNLSSSPTVAHFGPLGGGGTPRRSSDIEGDSALSSAVRASPARGAKATGSPSPSPTPQAHHGPPPPHHASSASAPRSTVYLYGRGNLHRSNAPIAHLPGHKTASLVIKFSPILYELRDDGRGVSSEDTGGIAPHPTVPLEVGKQKTVALSSAASTAGGMASSSAVLGKTPEEEGGSKRPSSSSSSSKATPVSMIGLPYRMIFAVATHDSVWIYDTQQGGPLCCFSNMHYASFTDLTWSPDGQTLMMCSTDGYCSVVVFDYGELGVPYQYASQPSLHQPPVSASVSSSVAVSSPRLASKAAVAMVSSASAPGASATVAPSSSVNALGLGISDSTDSATSTLPKLHEGDATSSSDDKPLAALPKDDDSAPSAKKRRRIAPTLQGPVGS
ncbi:WD40 repeat-like protein [Acaromyces ingoldii]|uniref:WD40 repeat-like protein n=1 Tax=Acaromyces ingoldii TaxID=215250 RepID=A0A316YFE9_9BASI|nr:WD40 repeat-like protein [Acaromyces ingoldii]PWN87604.1 WD40 repeat-like protein [Acaromyces ingoldii]